ncbi:MAG: hypothetical protein U0930_04380 [Pirellulales bacterium]
MSIKKSVGQFTSFWRSLSKKIWRKRARMVYSARRRRLLTLSGVEHLEGRLLMDASGLLYRATNDTPITLLVRSGQLEVVETAFPTQVFASSPLATLTQGAVIEGNGFDLRLTIDQSVPDVGGGISFLGGSGNSILVGPSINSTWRIDGANRGNLGGPSHLQFTDVKGLLGGSASDTFIIASLGQLTSLIDGGAGSDQIVLDNGDHLVTLAPVGGTSGTVNLTGRSINYTGMEPYDFYLSDFSNPSSIALIADPLHGNTLTVKHYDAGLIEVNRNNTAEYFAFQAPTQLLHIAMGGLEDNTLTLGAIGSNLTIPGSLLIDGGAAKDTVNITGPVTVSKGLSLDGKSGDLAVNINGSVIVNDGNMSIDGRASTGLVSAFNAPVEVHGSLSVLGGFFKDEFHSTSSIDVFGSVTIDNILSFVDEITGTDVAELGGNVSTHGGNFLANAANIQVGLATISTVGTGDAGEIKLDGKKISVASNGKLLATADVGANAGDITLKAFVNDLSALSPVDIIKTTDPSITVGSGAEIRGAAIDISAEKSSQTALLPISLVSLQHRKATIEIVGASIEGSDVSISATAADANVIDDPSVNIAMNSVGGPIMSTGYADLPGLLGLPPILSAISVQKRAADAAVSLSGTNIQSSGDVEINAAVDVSSDAKASGGSDTTKKKGSKIAEMVPFSAGFSRAEGKATTTIDGNSSIQASGSVTILSDATTAATVQAFTASNSALDKKGLKGVNGSKSVPAIAIGITESETTSTTLVGKDVQITASGNVTVNAQADVTNDAITSATIFRDGWGSVGVSMGSDKTNVLSRVDGHVVAGQGQQVETDRGLASLTATSIRSISPSMV